MGVFSILAFSHERLDVSSSGTSHLIENSLGYNFILFKWLIYRVKNAIGQKLSKTQVMIPPGMAVF